MSLVKMVISQNQKHGRHGNSGFSLGYKVASKSNKDSSKRRLNTLLYLMGSEAEKICSSFSFKKKDRKISNQ